jgi:hypothetical protein
MKRLFDFAFTDRQYRFKAYSLSGSIAFVCGLVCRLFLSWDEGHVLLTMAIVLYSLIAIFILYYVFVRKPFPPDATPPALPPLSRTAFRLGVVIIGFLIFSTQRNIVSIVQASVVDLRLAAVDEPVAPAFTLQYPSQTEARLRARFQKIQSIADISYRYKVPINTSRLSKTEAMIRAALRQPALSDQTKQAGLIASAKIGELAALRTTEANPIARPSYVINTNVELSDGSAHFVGDHSLITFGDGEIYIRRSTVVFDGVDFRGEQPFKEGLLVLDTDSHVIVRDSTVENLDQTLDGITWINVQFDHSMIKLNGGPFTLVNVAFKDCDLRWLMLSPVGFDLETRIAKANGQPISFASEGSTDGNSKHQ